MIFDATRIIHEEAGRTLSHADFDLCMRIAKRCLAATPVDRNADILQALREIRFAVQYWQENPTTGAPLPMMHHPMTVLEFIDALISKYMHTAAPAEIRALKDSAPSPATCQHGMQVCGLCGYPADQSVATLREDADQAPSIGQEVDFIGIARAALVQAPSAVPVYFVRLRKSNDRAWVEHGREYAERVQREYPDTYEVRKLFAAPPAPAPADKDAVLLPVLRELLDAAERHFRGEVSPLAHAIHKAHAAIAADRPAKDAKCEHLNRMADLEYIQCTNCGEIKTDGDWGIASNKWFESVEVAQFYQKHGRLPVAIAAEQKGGAE